MTDDISKVVRKIALEMKAHRAMGSRIEELDSWSRQLNEAIESATTPAEVGEVDHFAVSWRGDWNSTMRGYAEEYARRANATLARQLAEAKAENAIATSVHEHERLNLMSQLAEATRRLGEVRPVMDELVQCANVGRWDGKLIRAAQDWLAALTKEPTK